MSWLESQLQQTVDELTRVMRNEDVEHAEQAAQIRRLKERIAQLEAQVKALECENRQMKDGGLRGRFRRQLRALEEQLP